MRPWWAKRKIANSEFQTLRDLPITPLAADRAKSGTGSGRDPTRAALPLGKGGREGSRPPACIEHTQRRESLPGCPKQTHLCL